METFAVISGIWLQAPKTGVLAEIGSSGLLKRPFWIGLTEMENSRRYFRNLAESH
jgi:hypothetical protein